MQSIKLPVPTLSAYDDLNGMQTELDKCMHCGFCMAVCPVYKSTKTEASVARGKVGVAQAVIAGDLTLKDPEVVNMLFDCLVCESCMLSCPTKVDFAKIILALRCATVRENGLPWAKKIIFTALRHQKVFDSGMKTSALLSGLAFHPIDQSAMSLRSPLGRLGKSMGFDKDRILPALAKQPLRDRLPEVIFCDKRQTRVAFFTGCSFNYFYPETGEDLVGVLLANSVEVVIPQEQGCCGVPTFIHGDVETMRLLARKNLDAMEQSGVEYIVTGCGSCGGAWQHDYPEILKHDPVYGPIAEYWGKRTYDISTFLLTVIKYRRPQGQVDANVTYHDPCHLKKVMKVFREPREILQNIPGVTLNEMHEADACCGSGGSYVLTHFKTATAIAERKIVNANQTRADTIATGCPACMMQLVDNVHRFGNRQKVRHYISILAESYRMEKNRDEVPAHVEKTTASMEDLSAH